MPTYLTMKETPETVHSHIPIASQTYEHQRKQDQVLPKRDGNRCHVAVGLDDEAGRLFRVPNRF